MKRTLLLLFVSLMLNVHSWAQLINYSSKGIRKTKVTSEKIDVNVELIDDPENQALPAGFVLGAASAAISPLLKVGKTYLDKRAASFSASYFGAVTDKTLNFRSRGFTPFKLSAKRMTSVDEGKNFETVASIVLKTDRSESEPVFRFKLTSLTLNASKARIRRKNRKNTGRAIDLNVEIQVNVHYRDDLKMLDSTSKPKTFGYSLKTATLGTSAITIPGIRPDGKEHDFSEDDDNRYFSDWFQLIPDPSLSESVKKIVAGDLTALAFWTTVKVTVKEANPHGVNATKIAEFFSSGEEGLGELLKALIPTPKEEK